MIERCKLKASSKPELWYYVNTSIWPKTKSSKGNGWTIYTKLTPAKGFQLKGHQLGCLPSKQLLLWLQWILSGHALLGDHEQIAEQGQKP